MIAAIAIAACTLTLSLGDGPRRRVIGELVDDVILPTYTDVVAAVEVVSDSAHAFQQSPTSSNLGALRAAWRAAREPWKETDAFRFGPMSLQSLGVAMDQVIDSAKVETEISGTQTIDAAYFASLGANKKGFHAIEYLIFDTSGLGDAGMIAMLVDPRRMAFLVGATDDLVVNAHALLDAWTDLAETVSDPGPDREKPYVTIKGSFDTFVNELANQAESVADSRIGKPFGVNNGGVLQPELEESRPSDNSVADMAAVLRGIRNIYFGSRDGTPGKGIGGLVAAKSVMIDNDVRTALVRAQLAVDAIPRPFHDAILAADPRAIEARDAILEIKHVIHTEVVSILGTTINFNDNDGD